MKEITDQQIDEIASEIEIGLRCFWNKETGQLLSIPDESTVLDDDEFFVEEKKMLKKDRKNYIEIEKPGPKVDFDVMRDFAAQLDDNEPIKHRLQYILENSKPFRHFRNEIDNSWDHREQWFKFRTQQVREWVMRYVRDRINQEDQDSDELL